MIPSLQTASPNPVRHSACKRGGILPTVTLALLALLALAPLGIFSVCRAQSFTPQQLRILENAITDTGVTMGQIPSISKPDYLSVYDAALSMEADEQVFIARFPNNIHIYPQRILVYHEVINEEVDGTPVSVTYSPLSGSLVGYKGHVGRYDTNFGVAGGLLNANSLLFDYATGSLWPQLLGVAIKGPLTGATLERFPLLWSTWNRASEAFPSAQVLSRTTGFRRQYGRDPYGGYSNPESYYHAQTISHPVRNVDNRLPPKERIVGIERDELRYALAYGDVERAGVVNFAMGVVPMVAIWDRQLQTIRVYERLLAGKTLEFNMRDGKVVDTATSSEWSADGRARFGSLRETVLTPVLAVDAMWFSWIAFFPDTFLVGH